ncbi:MAG TPA: hypothetical protein VJA16_11435 [Thermoanaerobaculia bacterium]
MAAARWDRLASVGRIFFAVPIVAFGVMHLLWQGFVTRMVPPLPAWVPWRSFWACLLGVVLIAIGAAILLEIRTRLAALALGTMMVLSVVLLYGPRVAANAGVGGAYTAPMKFVALAGCAFLIARLSSEGRRVPAGRSSGARRARWERTLPARIVLAGFLTLCGLLHFVYSDFVATLVPGWIPYPYFWTYFAGVALIAGGAGLLVDTTKRGAALLSGGMIFTWFVILHIPRALADPHDTMEWSSVWESLAFSGMAFLLAATSSPAVERQARDAPANRAGP